MKRVQCPGCKQSLQLPDNLAGRKVACPSCGEKMSLPEMPSATAARAWAKEREGGGTQVREERRPRPAVADEPRRQPHRERADDRGDRRSRDDFDDEEPRRRRRKRAKGGANLALWIGLPLAGLALIATVIIIIVVVKNRPDDKGKAPIAGGPVGGGGPVLPGPGAGVGSNNAGKIEGTSWTSQAANIGGAFVPAGAMQLDFGHDGSLTWRITDPATRRELVITGRYTLQAGNTVLFSELNQPLAGSRTHSENISITGGTLVLSDMSGVISFSRR